MIRNLVFDVGGVLQHVEYAMFFDALALQAGGDPDRIQQAHDLLVPAYDRGALDAAAFVAALSREAGIPLDVEGYFDLFFPHTHVNRSLLHLLRDTLAKRFRLYILSNNAERNTIFFQAQHGLEGLLAGEFYSYRHQAIKPELPFYQAFLAQAEILPEETVFIDDREENLVPARALGMHGIRFQGNDRLLRELRELASF